MSKYSDCCGAAPRSNGDCDTEDFGICSDCKEHCEYIEYCDDCGEEECICCEECNGTGEKEITIGGNGDPEADVPVVCIFCNGTGRATQNLQDDLKNVL